MIQETADNTGSVIIGIASALTAATGGVKTAIHGSTAAFSKCRTEACLAALGVNPLQSSARCSELLERVGICFFSEAFAGPELPAIQICTEDLESECSIERELQSGSPRKTAEMIAAILQGQKGPFRESVLKKAGKVLYTAGKADSIEEGIRLAGQLIDSEEALETLHRLIEISNRPEER